MKSRTSAGRVRDKKPKKRIGPYRKHEPVGNLDKCQSCGFDRNNPVHQNARGEGL